MTINLVFISTGAVLTEIILYRFGATKIRKRQTDDSKGIIGTLLLDLTSGLFKVITG